MTPHSPRSDDGIARYGYNAGTYHSGYRTHTGEPEATALNVAGNPNSNSTPTPAPRGGTNPNGHLLHSNNTSLSSGGPTFMPPPLNTKPNKSAMRSPLLYQLPPAAHLGGSSLNDTLNSSFAGSHAVPPSVSADV
ncbi:hypothetical protein DdX_12794 [Ditylenchus destructor]|uniref:Uncharacterized protein n=1 Tax=Ditylenchus destructor TaxID=166010 RepID=A0AAD4MX51_9BILA|nr:hypothetical protein DdX_12794 [Ditylenchus destructor]